MYKLVYCRDGNVNQAYKIEFEGTNSKKSLLKWFAHKQSQTNKFFSHIVEKMEFDEKRLHLVIRYINNVNEHYIGVKQIA